MPGVGGGLGTHVVVLDVVDEIDGVGVAGVEGLARGAIHDEGIGAEIAVAHEVEHPDFDLAAVESAGGVPGVSREEAVGALWCVDPGPVGGGGQDAVAVVTGIRPKGDELVLGGAEFSCCADGGERGATRWEGRREDQGERSECDHDFEEREGAAGGGHAGDSGGGESSSRHVRRSVPGREAGGCDRVTDGFQIM